MYGQKHWEHQEKVLVQRQMRNSMQSGDYDLVPVSSLQTRLFVDIPTLSIVTFPQIRQPGYDDVYDEISPIGSMQSVINSTQPIAQQPYPESCTAVEDDVGVVNCAMTSFYEAVQAIEPKEPLQLQEPTKHIRPRKTSFKPSSSSVSSVSLTRSRASPRLSPKKVTSIPYNPYRGKDYESINEILHSMYGYSNDGYLAQEMLKAEDAKKDLGYLMELKKGALPDDPDNIMISFWKIKLIDKYPTLE
jgi:hypothetical protein